MGGFLVIIKIKIAGLRYTRQLQRLLNHRDMRLWRYERCDSNSCWVMCK